MGLATAKKNGAYAEINTTAARAKKYITENSMSVSDFAKQTGYTRETMSRYLNGRYECGPTAIEASITDFLNGKTGIDTKQEEEKATPETANAVEAPEVIETIEAAEDTVTTENTEANEISKQTENTEPEKKEAKDEEEPAVRKKRRISKKSGFFESDDAKTVMGVCEACQEDNEMGIIIGRSGFGKTYALREYAKLPRTAYIECDVTMSTRDLLKDIERALGIPQTSSGTNHERVNGIIDFLTINKGYLIIVDEADKLMSRYTQDKMHILRRIFDGTAGDNDRATCGIVIAGEPKLEAQVKMYLEQYAKRIIYGGELKGLSPSEVRGYLDGYEIEDLAVTELINRACNPKIGCFRLLDRTMRNVVRKLKANGESVITPSIIKQASDLMLL